MVRSLSHWRKTFSFPTTIQQSKKCVINEQNDTIIANQNRKNILNNNEICTILTNSKDTSDKNSSSSSSTISINEQNMHQQVFYLNSFVFLRYFWPTNFYSSCLRVQLTTKNNIILKFFFI